MNSLYGDKYGKLECPRCNNSTRFLGGNGMLKCGVCNTYLYHPIHLEELK